MLGSKKNFIAYPIVLLLGLGFIALLILGRPQPKERNLAPSPVPIVQVLDVKESLQPLTIRSQGVVSAATRVELVAEVSGRVLRVDDSFAPGGQFSAQQILIELDDADYLAAYSQAQANVAEAERMLAVEQGSAKQAQREWRDLKSEEANALFLRKPQIASAKANLQAARAARDKAKTDLNRTKISLPFDGGVLRQEVDQGEYVVAGRSIGEVFALGSAEIRLPLSTSQYYRLGDAIGAEVKVSAKAAGIRHDWLGKIIRVESNVDPVSRMHHVVATVDDAFVENAGKPALALGQFVEAGIQTLLQQPVYEIPRKALRQPQNIWLLDNESVLYVVDVEVILRDQNRAFVQLKERAGQHVEGSFFISDKTLRVVTSSLALAVSGTKTTVDQASQRPLSSQ